jgi:hypothetical protein
LFRLENGAGRVLGDGERAVEAEADKVRCPATATVGAVCSLDYAQLFKSPEIPSDAPFGDGHLVGQRELRTPRLPALVSDRSED